MDRRTIVAGRAGMGMGIGGTGLGGGRWEACKRRWGMISNGLLCTIAARREGIGTRRDGVGRWEVGGM